MLQFLREKTSMIMKLVCYQLAMIVFAMATTTPVVKSPTLLLAVSLFGVGFYLFLCYNAVWTEGAKDALKIDHGRMEYRPLGGAMISLGANALNLVLAIWVPISRCFVLPSGSGVWEYFTLGSDALVVNPSWLYNLYTIPRWIIHFIQFPFAGIYTRFMPQNPFAYLIGTAITVATCAIAYVLGRKNFRFFSAQKKNGN